MIYKIQPSALSGNTYIPGSKSHTIRAVFIASLAQGESKIISPLESEDAFSSVEACRGFGVDIQTGKEWTIRGKGAKAIEKKTNTIDIGNSGTTARFVLGMAALGNREATITGDEQSKARPMASLIDALNNLGAEVRSLKCNGCLPISVKGRLKGGATEVSGVTSQFLSSLLISCPLAEGDSVISLPYLNEQPYAEMTLKWLDSQNIEYENYGFKRFVIKGNQSYKPFNRHVPADFSSATFFLCAASITESDIILKGLDMNDSQGDKKVIDFLKAMGANISHSDKGIRVRGGDLKGIEIDMNETPDALPAMAVVGCFASGKTILRNVSQARLKETDRISVMCKELRKMGAKLDELPDGMVIYKSILKGAALNGHGDHRIVMSLAVAGLIAHGETVIEGAEAVNITFPDFGKIMKKLGASICLSEKITPKT